MAPRLGLVTLPGLDHFTHDIVARLSQTHNVTKYEIKDMTVFRTAVEASDILWFEFLWPPFLDLINTTNFGNKRVMVRLHAVEATERDFPKLINWAQVDDLIVVSEKMVDIVREHVPDIQSKTRVSVVYNGVDVDKYTLPDAPHHAKQIAWAGRLIPKKDPMMAIQILHKLVQRDPDYHLHFAGSFDDAIVRRYLLYMVEQLDLQGNVTFHGSVDDMPALLGDCSHFLSTSISESFGYAIAEGMAAGLQTLVHAYPGVDEFWPNECVFETIGQAADMIDAGQLPNLSEHIANNFSLDRQIETLTALIGQDHTSEKRKTHSTTRSVQFEYAGFPICFINLDPVDHTQRIILLTRTFHQEPALKELRDRLPGDGIVVDIGAGIGNHTIFFAKVCQRTIAAFTPSTSAAAALKEQVEANSVLQQVDIRPSLPAALDAEPLPGPVRLLRIAGDIPAHETLNGAATILREHKPLLSIETEDKTALSSIAEMLQPLGYALRTQSNKTALFTVAADWPDAEHSSVA